LAFDGIDSLAPPECRHDPVSVSPGRDRPRVRERSAGFAHPIEYYKKNQESPRIF